MLPEGIPLSISGQTVCREQPAWTGPEFYFAPVIVNVRMLSAGIVTSFFPVAAATPVPAPAPAAVPIAAPLPPPARPPISAPAAAPPPILVTLLVVWLLPSRLTRELYTISPLMEV